MGFSDISAYRKSKVSVYMRKVLADPSFVALLDKVKGLNKLLNVPSYKSLVKKLGKITTIRTFNSLMTVLLKHNIQTTTDEVSYSGLGNIPKNSGYTLMSNHRSTSLDPLYVNYVLHNLGFPTTYTGCGDNIFKTKWLEHIIRLNKGFVVKRQVEDLDEKLLEAKRLSMYIKKLVSKKKSVWIAHRNGRAKNGSDETDSVLITMLYKGFNTGNYQQWLEEFCMIPLTISWEIVPCDLLMAEEVTGELAPTKSHRDLKNILHEIKSKKGRLHVSFGKRVYGSKRNEIVNTIDKEIQSNFRLWDSNWLAYILTEDLSSADKDLISAHINFDKAEAVLDRRDTISENAQKHFLAMYANPVRNALKYSSLFEVLDDKFSKSEILS